MSDVIELLERANPLTLEQVGPVDETVARDLLQRAVVSRPRRRPLVRRPVRLVLAIAIVLLLAVPLASAFGLGDWLLNVDNHSTVPPAVQKLFADVDQPPVTGNQGPPSRGMEIIESSERLVAQIHTASGKTGSLYVADVKGGGWCMDAIGGPFNGGGCSRIPFARSASLIVQGGVGMGAQARGQRFADTVTTIGRTRSATVTAIRVDYRDGTSGSIPLAPGGWFLYEVPHAHLAVGKVPYRFVALGANGRVLGTVKDPVLLEQKQSAPHRPIASTIRELVRLPLGWRDADVVLSEARDQQGERCVRELNTRDLVQTQNWDCGAWVGTRATSSPVQKGPSPLVSVGVGKRVWPGHPGWVYLDGWAVPPVASVELRYQDSQVVQIPLHDRYFVLVIPSRHWLPGHRPSYVVGRDASGKAVFRKFLYPLAKCSYPGPGNRCPPGERVG
jgi:hypothetical protein